MLYIKTKDIRHKEPGKVTNNLPETLSTILDYPECIAKAAESIIAIKRFFKVADYSFSETQ